MFCKNCGFEIANDALFCAKCGTRQDATFAQPAPANDSQPYFDPYEATGIMTSETEAAFEDEATGILQEEPAPAAEPSYAYQEPVYQQPAYQEPVYQQPVYQQPVYQDPVYQQPVYQPQATVSSPSKGKGITGMIMGIASLVLSVAGFCYFFGIVTLPLSIVAMAISGGAARVAKSVGAKDTPAKLGKTFGIIALILSILGLICSIALVAISTSAGGSSYYY